MKIKFLSAVALLALSLSMPSGIAADQSEASTELKALVSKIQTKLRDGKKTEADLADEIKEFDALLAKHKSEKTDDVARILSMKASLYEQVLKDTAKGDALKAQLKRDFPDSEPVKMMQQQEEAEKIKEAAGHAMSQEDVCGIIESAQTAAALIILRAEVPAENTAVHLAIEKRLTELGQTA